MFLGYGTADFFHIQKYAQKKKKIQRKNTNQWHIYIYINGWRRRSRALTHWHQIVVTLYTQQGDFAQRLGQ